MAVYTHITENEAKDFCQRFYDLPEVTGCHPFAEGTDNSNYHLKTADGDYVLTLFEGSADAEDLPAIFDFARQIGEKVISTPRLQKTKTGKDLGHLKGKPAAIVSFLPGQSIDPPDIAETGQMAEVLGRMHAFAAGADTDLPDNMYSLPKLEAMFERASKNIHRFDSALIPEISDLLSRLAQDLPAAASLPAGPIHGDLFADNVFFDQGKLSGVIDFYMACRDWLAYDLAITINAWCFDQKGDARPDALRQFLADYQEIRPLSATERKALPLIGQWAALRIALTRLRDYYPARDDIVFTPRDPRPYMRIIDFYANQKMDVYL